jgi:RNase H-fold protein (predicted Holliday junction resolvase)
MVFQFRAPGWLAKKLRKKPVVTLVVGKPVHPEEGGSVKERTEALREATHARMEVMIESARPKKRRMKKAEKMQQQ